MVTPSVGDDLIMQVAADPEHGARVRRSAVTREVRDIGE
jgi:hypothetical protein